MDGAAFAETGRPADDGPLVEVLTACQILNRMLELGKPESIVRITESTDEFAASDASASASASASATGASTPIARSPARSVTTLRNTLKPAY